MMLSREGMDTKVWITPYKKSSIDENTYIRATDQDMIVSSVRQYEDYLVRLILPDGETAIVDAVQLITAIQKCVR